MTSIWYEINAQRIIVFSAQQSKSDSSEDWRGDHSFVKKYNLLTAVDELAKLSSIKDRSQTDRVTALPLTFTYDLNIQS